MEMKQVLIAAAVAATIALTGCSGQQTRPSAQSIDLVKTVEEAAIALTDTLPAKDRSMVTVLGTSFANIDNLDDSSTLGRLIGDSLAGELAEQGYKLLEIRLRDSLFVQQGNGELMLSRELLDISSAHNAKSVLVGTYAVGGEYVYVNARMIDTVSSQVMAAHDFRVPMNRDVKKLLNSGR